MPTAVTIGNFDGVHIGHQAVLGRARAFAGEAGRVVAVTFDPHPVSRLRPGSEPPKLMPIDTRVALLKQHGADHVEVIQPSDAFLQQSAEDFVHWVIETFQPQGVFEGPDFRFGKGRLGDNRMLSEIGQQQGFGVTVLDRLTAVLTNQHVVPVSSSIVRWLVAEGRVMDAALCLGDGFTLQATVEKGEQRGRTIGIPTANLRLDELAGHMLPAHGVYAGQATLADGQRYRAAISVGVKPTFGESRLTVEAHLLEAPALDLYDQPLAVRFDRWVRGQQAFASVDHLVEQLHRDLAAVRKA